MMGHMHYAARVYFHRVVRNPFYIHGKAIENKKKMTTIIIMKVVERCGDIECVVYVDSNKICREKVIMFQMSWHVIIMALFFGFSLERESKATIRTTRAHTHTRACVAAYGADTVASMRHLF